MGQNKTMKPMPTLATVITPFPYYIDSQASLAEAKQQMTKRGIHHLIVKTEGDISGLVSEHDLHQHIDNQNDLIVDDICASSPVVADIHDPLDKVLEAMSEQHLGSVIALREGELVGIFTTTDACRAFAHYLRANDKGEQPDDWVA